MAFDAFLVFTSEADQPAYQGETLDAQFSTKHAVQLKSFSLGIANTVSVGSQSGGAGVGKAQFQEFKITKLVDHVSPTLLQLAGSGGHLGQVDLYLRKAGGGSKDALVYLQYTFKLVYVTALDWSGDSGEEAVSEAVTFKYGALKVQYTAQKPSGQKGSTTTGIWNQVTNKSSFTVPGIG